MNYGGGGKGGSAIIVVLVLFCCMLSIMGLAGFWTCTGGTFDGANFDSAKCLQVPGGDVGPADVDDDDDAGGGGTNNMNTPSWDTSNPSDLEQGDEYLLCVGTVFPNDAKTCFVSDQEGAGVRWKWADSAEATACSQKVARWRIDVTSDSESHAKVYTHTINNGTASSFSFVGAPSGFVTGTFVRFRISAIDAYGALLMPSVNIELDVNTSTSTCGDVGISNPVQFDTLTVSAATNINMGDDPHLPPAAENPVDCVGGEWVAVGDCLVDGSPVDKDTCGPSCTQKYELQNITTPAAHGGECITEKYEQIARGSCNPTVMDPAIDCVVGDWFDTTPCSATCGGGTKTQNRPVLVDDENNGQPCPTLVQTVACNTQECPINCVGEWRTDGDAYWPSPLDCGTSTLKQNWVYRVTTSPNAYGAACGHADGATKTLAAEPRQSKSRRCKGH